jgi:ABC-type Fe3+ transport system permease subunit
MASKAKKTIVTVVVLSLVLLPVIASFRRAWFLKQGPGFEEQTFWRLFWNSLYSKYHG